MRPTFIFSIIVMISLSACGQMSKTQPKSSVQNIDNKEFRERMKDTNSVVLDVRSSDEFFQGHIDSAVNVDWNEENFGALMEKKDKTKTYLVYCQVGGRSGKATQWMVDHGFTSVYNLSGGYDAWRK